MKSIKSFVDPAPQYESDSEDERSSNSLEWFKEWMLKYNVSHVAGNALLKHLNQNFPDSGYPLNCNAAFSMSIPTEIVRMGGGEFFYHGVRNKLTRLLDNHSFPMNMKMCVFIDGLPPFRSSSAQF